ncbi:adenylate/guanylate cyclase domain-containing protein [Mycobacterium sp.]|uniref:adenylate/guanylate cyclase domain-containing protein n=1 Tax=Mycobacterium sp. TaxID=1785 RepID=UPI0026009033|nr:adenylate/guanylate cyclase domain-containing protein [Mycobacterium sp.]
MMATRSTAQRLGRLLERVTKQSGRLPETPAYGSWLLGKVSESQGRRRVRIQLILTVFILGANVIGIGVSTLLLTVAFPKPSIFSGPLLWITFGVTPAYCVVALGLGTYLITRRTTGVLRWAIEEHDPTPADERATFTAPFWLAFGVLTLWVIGTALLTTLYGLANSTFIPIVGFCVSVCGILVSTACYLFTEFALRPVAAQALEAGGAPRRLAPGIMGRTLTVWLLGSGVPVLGIIVTALLGGVLLDNLSKTQLAVAILVISGAALVFGFVLMWILAWLTATPVRVVRAALKRVEDGDLRGDLVVFDGTELGELQRGFNAMVDGLRERERVRDLFGRHVGREVAAAAERDMPQLGGEERHVAVVFIDVIGSTKLVTSRPAAEVVQLLNRFFAVIVEEVDRHHGLVNKFEGDAVLAVFGAPNHLDRPEAQALSAARAIAHRLDEEVPEIKAGIGVTAGKALAGNVGAKERFEYTVIGEPVNEAARLCELAKNKPHRLLASSNTVNAAGDEEQARWSLGESVTLRGHDQPTQLATLA